MTIEEALAWVRGERSHTNTMQQVTDPSERAQTLVDIERADAATTERAYWILRAHNEDLHDRLAGSIPESSRVANVVDQPHLDRLRDAACACAGSAMPPGHWGWVGRQHLDGKCGCRP